MFYKVEAVSPLPDYCLLVRFRNGVEKHYDVKPLFSRWDVFKSLQQGNLFQAAKVDEGGYGISWNDDIDLSCNELFLNGY